MTDEQTEYRARLAKRDIRAWQPPLPTEDKVKRAGEWMPFYGLTCIAMVDPASALYRELGRVQTDLRARLEAIGLGHIYVWLKPETFHMTVCDLIVTGSVSVAPKRKTELIEQVHSAFEQIGRPGPVRCHPTGLGLKRTIGAMVLFPDPKQLDTVIEMERTIKAATGVDMRDFTGHISLAYLVPRPEIPVAQIKEVMLAYQCHDFGEFLFDRFDLAAFTDMNTYRPILTKNLVDGTIIRR